MLSVTPGGTVYTAAPPDAVTPMVMDGRSWLTATEQKFLERAIREKSVWKGEFAQVSTT